MDVGLVSGGNLSRANLASRFSPDIYTDLNQLNNINRVADEDKNAALKKMAQQFEGLFIQMMLKTMREANAVFAEEKSSEMDFHQTMFDNQLALNLANGGGLGLAESFYQQMVANYSEEDASKSLNGNRITNVEPFSAPKLMPKTAPVVDLSETIPDTPAEFVKALYPHAKKIADRLGVDPAVLIAQSALETGWGKHIIKDKYGNSSNNLFNIKADSRWQGEKVNIQTIEYRDGLAVKERANFRRYDSIEESFRDYAQLIISEPRYSQARQASSSEDYMEALQEAGYATDPRYADKVKALLNQEVILTYREDKSRL